MSVVSFSLQLFQWRINVVFVLAGDQASPYQAEQGISCIISVFDSTTVLQNMQITRKIPDSDLDILIVFSADSLRQHVEYTQQPC